MKIQNLINSNFHLSGLVYCLVLQTRSVTLYQALITPQDQGYELLEKAQL